MHWYSNQNVLITYYFVNMSNKNVQSDCAGMKILLFEMSTKISGRDTTSAHIQTNLTCSQFFTKIVTHRFTMEPIYNR